MDTEHIDIAKNHDYMKACFLFTCMLKQISEIYMIYTTIHHLPNTHLLWNVLHNK